MIVPQELRLGNYVEYKGYFYQVWSIGNNSNPRRESYFIDLDSSNIDNHLKGVDSNDVSPIELSEEWLLKFGYERDKNEYCISGHDRFNVFQSVKGPYIFCDDEKSIRYVKYVHELQNLFFALTGEELTIKEQP